MTQKIKINVRLVTFLMAIFLGNTITNYAQTASTKADSILGKWTNEDKTKIIEFLKNGNTYEAIVRKAEKSESIGKKMITELVLRGKEYNGKVYIPKTKKIYDCNIIFLNPKTIELTAKSGFMSQSRQWTKME